MNAPVFTAEQKTAILDKMKEELIRDEGKVERKTVDEALTQIGQAAALFDLLGIKIVQDFFGEVTMESVAMGLRVHKHATFDMHLPCGTKFCVVMHHRENHSIQTFTYKL